MSADKRMKRHCEEEVNFETEFCQAIALSIILACKNTRKERGLNEPRSKTWWEQGYLQWNDAAFKRRFRMSRETFHFILGVIREDIAKQPTIMNPYPAPPNTQLAICLYRLTHGCTFLTVGDLFGVAAPTAHCIFLEVCNVLVRKMYDDFVYLPKTLEDWTKELQGFLESWEFPCVGA